MANSSLAASSGSSLALGGWSLDQLNIIKGQIAVNCTDGELELFSQVCARTGLDPFTRQIYAISRNQWNPSTKQSEPKMTIQLSIDGFRATASSSGCYAGSQTFWCGEDGQWKDVWLANSPPAAAKTEVFRTGCDRPFVGVARFDSYAQKKKDGSLMGQWPSMPDVMIGKCSEALALRKAFPAQLSGLYSTEEMGQASNGGEIQAGFTRMDLWSAAQSKGWTKASMMQLLKEYGFTGEDGEGTLSAIPQDKLGSLFSLVSDLTVVAEYAAKAIDDQPIECASAAIPEVAA